MAGTREFRELLVADLALVRGVASARDVAMALQRYWDERARERAGVVPELCRLMGREPAAFAEVEAEADRLLHEAGGDGRLALTRRGGLDRSVHLALGPAGAGITRALSVLGVPIRAALSPLRPERYVGFEVAGAGGMGVVYAALDTEMNRRVAFKMVRTDTPGATEQTPSSPLEARKPVRESPASEDFEQLKARLVQEAWVTGGLEHPGIVPVYEIGQTPTGIPYYTMRFVRGDRTLADAIQEKKGAPFEERLALLEPFLKVCDAVHYAHDRGVVHRDLKPQNVALGDYGEVVVLDWGMARLEGREDVGATAWRARVEEMRQDAGFHTLEGGALGTAGYMSPEAARGRLAEVDARSDVYSLGVILYEVLTGRLPHVFRSFPEYAALVLREDAPPPREVAASVPESLSNLCARAVAREKGERPASARALAEAIRAWQRQDAVDREVDTLLRDATGALASAAALQGRARLLQVDRAIAALEQIDARKPDAAITADARARARALREAGMRERERSATRRVLLRVGLGLAAVLTVAAVVVVGLLDQRRREAEEARSAARDAEALALAQAARANQERDANARALEEILRLSDSKKVLDLERDAAAYTPVTPLPDLVGWDRRAEELLERLPRHRETLSRLRGQGVASESGVRFADEGLAWQHWVLSDLVAALTHLGDPAGEARARVNRLRRGAAASADPAWAEARRRVAENPRYGGLVLAPQAGLVPLGPDPDSGLEEFAHPWSGVLPTRDGASGRLVLPDAFCVVLVLLPGGTFTMGAQKEDPNGPNFDPHAESDEAPLQEVALRPCFVGKYECTQAQWAALAGEWPSKFEDEPRARLPVDQVSWEECQRVLGEFGLRLPRSAEWEFACRAGTGTPFHTGPTAEGLDAAAWWTPNSGNKTHPVGSLKPNAFGVHDMHGNLWEWCEDAYPVPASEQPAHPFQRGMTARGGSWNDGPRTLRSAKRVPLSVRFKHDYLGCRAARSLDTDR